MELVIAGIIACLAMDGFQRLLWLTIGQPPSNWAVVGRWAFIVLRSARLYQPDIDTARHPRELPFGWFVHYTVGVGYVVIYPMMQTGPLTAACLMADMVLFCGSRLFFLPVMGKGIMGTNTPAPVRVCVLALANH